MAEGAGGEFGGEGTIQEFIPFCWNRLLVSNWAHPRALSVLRGFQCAISKKGNVSIYKCDLLLFQIHYYDRYCMIIQIFSMPPETSNTHLLSC